MPFSLGGYERNTGVTPAPGAEIVLRRLWCGPALGRPFAAPEPHGLGLADGLIKWTARNDPRTWGKCQSWGQKFRCHPYRSV